jgi:hypothetical protein
MRNKTKKGKINVTRFATWLHRWTTYFVYRGIPVFASDVIICNFNERFNTPFYDKQIKI